MTQRKPTYFVGMLVVVAALTASVHAPALKARALSFSDHEYLVDNPLVCNPSWNSVRRFVGEVLAPSTVDGYYQPLTMISLMADDALGGRPDDSRIFHRTSLALHVINTMLIAALLYLLFGEPWPAAVVGLLFGMHPLTVETIPWISERKTLLAAFFVLVSLIAYIRYTQSRRLGFFIGATAAYLLALLSKPTSTPLPLVLLLLDVWPLRRFSRRAVIEKLPLFALAGVSAVVTFISQRRTAGVTMPGEHSLFDVPFKICHNVMFYLYKMVWPASLSSYYPIPSPMNLSDPWVAAGVIGICLLIPLLIWSSRRTPAFAVGGLAYFFLLLPTIQIVGFSDVIASDKYAYLPSLGILISFAWLLGRWKIFSPNSGRRAVAILVELLLIAAATGEAIATRDYLADWKDTETLCRRMLRLAPKAASVHYSLALDLADQGRSDEAVAEYQKAVQDNPNLIEAWNNLGMAYSARGRTNDAYECWVRVLQIHAANYTAAYNLGTWFAERGQTREAHRYLDLAVRSKPTEASAHTNFAAVLVQEGLLDEAISHLRQSIALSPKSARAQHNLAMLLLRSGQLKEAIEHYREAARGMPESADMHYNLAEALRQDRQWEEAAREFRETLRIDPSHAAARAGLQSITTTQPK